MDHNFNPVELAILALSTLFAKHLADILGPIAVIILFAGVGAGWAISRREEQLTRVGLALFFVRIILTALAVTALAAETISRYFSPLPAAWFIGPLAFLIGAIGDDWTAIGRWASSGIAAWVRRKIGE